jgi:hypothetical protein
VRSYRVKVSQPEITHSRPSGCVRSAMSRERLTRTFLWVSVLAWGVGFGAKLFDLLVLASAWGASPPSSLVLYPYGIHWPINPGDFFQPLSGLLLVASLGALIAGWKTRGSYRNWLAAPVIALSIIWIVTPTVFWPMINAFYAVWRGRLVMSEIEQVHLVHRWIVADSLRVFAILVGFISAIRSISVPYPLIRTTQRYKNQL